MKLKRIDICNRFKKTKDSYRKSFTNIAEYIRHQIQLTKPKFQTIDFWTEQALINESRRAKIPSVFPGRKKLFIIYYMYYQYIYLIIILESAPSSSSVKPAEPVQRFFIFMEILSPQFYFM